MNELKEKLMKLTYKEWTKLKRDIDIYHLEKEKFEEVKKEWEETC